MSQFRNLVFEGGGVKGIAYVGAMEVLQKRGIFNDIKRVGGTSAGAINAVLLACGYSNVEQRKILSDLDFEKFMDDDIGVIRDTKRLTTEFGWHKGDFFQKWIAGLIKARMKTADITFREMLEKGCPELYLVGTNLSTGYAEVFSAEHTPNIRVLDAIRISMSIPLFFAAIRAARGDVYVDGGMMNNYPVKLFDRKKYIEDPKAERVPDYYKAENKVFLKGANKNRSPYVYNKETLGFRLDSKRKIAAFRYGDVAVVNEIDGFFEFCRALIKAALNVQESQHLHTDDWHRTVYIDTKGVGTIDFKLSADKKTELIDSGRNSTQKYFNWLERDKAKRKAGEEVPVNII